MRTTQSETASDLWRWDSVQRRDPAAEGKFWYSVATTGVYCRPTCPARLPLRQNVAFYASREEAERAGFRPCKRCKPDQASQRERLKHAIARARALIDAGELTPTVTALAAAVGLSPYYFHRSFRVLTGLTVKEYALAQRSQRVRRELTGEASVTEAIYQAGYGSSSRFYESARSVLGMTPTAFRRAGKGVAIRYAVVASSLGAVLIAATAHGVCRIEFGEDAQDLVQSLRTRFSHAEFVPADAEFKRWVDTVLEHIEAPRGALDVPLELIGTAFQQRVWRALRDIPAGATTSYTGLAERIGEPTAARAVAHACASNSIALAVPCHRVIGSDGALRGYRWGIERKRALLARESRQASAESSAKRLAARRGATDPNRSS